MNRIFIDTAFVVALVNQKDQYHKQALILSQEYENTPMIITEAILLEIGNALAKDFKHEAVDIINAFQSSDEVITIEQNTQLFQKGFEMYEKYQDKDWGIVDCISFVAMRENNVTDALTLDDHFKQAGFNILMRK